MAADFATSRPAGLFRCIQLLVGPRDSRATLLFSGAFMWKKISVWIGALGVLIAAGLTLISFFVLPACDSDTVKDTIHSIFEKTSVTLTVLDQIRALADTNATKTCQAHVESTDEKATINYTVSWNGWTVQVKIDTVESVPPEPPPAG
jgi:hypothetical protein